MMIRHRRFCLSALLATIVAVGGCATQPSPQVDPIFQAVPGGRYHCSYQQDDRNAVVKAGTSTVGQSAIGGAAGGLIGNQFGGRGAGQNIATGIGAAAGVAAGAWNARRMQNNRLQQCEQQGGNSPQQSGY